MRELPDKLRLRPFQVPPWLHESLTSLRVRAEKIGNLEKPKSRAWNRKPLENPDVIPSSDSGSSALCGT